MYKKNLQIIIKKKLLLLIVNYLIGLIWDNQTSTEFPKPSDISQ